MFWVLSSVVERPVHIGKVVGSNPAAPTKIARIEFLAPIEAYITKT